MGAPANEPTGAAVLKISPSSAMNPTSPPPAMRRSARRLWLWGLLATPLLLLLLVGAGVASFFHLGSDARALRNELIKSSGVEWRQQIALNGNWLALGAIRAGLSFVNLDPGARAAIQSVRSAGVGVYQLASGAPLPHRGAMFVTADSAMTARGWERVVGVLDGEDLVAIYVPEKNISVHHLNVACWCLTERNWSSFQFKAIRNRSSNTRSLKLTCTRPDSGSLSGSPPIAMSNDIPLHRRQTH
jgi:hypothetical protein